VQVAIRTLSKQDTLQAVLHILQHMPDASPSLHETIFNLWLATGITLTAMVNIGYSFAASLQRHRNSDGLIGLVHSVWLGEAPMHVLIRMGELLRGLARILDTLRKIKLEDSPGAGLIPEADVLQMLQKLCPGKSADRTAIIAHSLTLHQQGSFIRVGDIQCCGVDCTKIIDTAELCGSRSLNSPQSDGVQLEAGEGAVDLQGRMVEEPPVPEAGKHISAEISEQQKHVGKGQSAVVHALDSDHGLQATPNGTQASGALSDGQTNDDATDSDSSPQTLPVVLLHQHAEELQKVRQATWEAVCAHDVNHWPEGASLSEMQRILESVPGVERSVIPGCVHVWSRLPCPSSQERVADRLLASAPIQKAQDFDVVAAAAWVEGLQGKEDGCGSAALLPEVV
jgi:hypothetical protein